MGADQMTTCATQKKPYIQQTFKCSCVTTALTYKMTIRY